LKPSFRLEIKWIEEDMLVEVQFVCGAPDNGPGWKKGGFEGPATGWDDMWEAGRVCHADSERLFDDTREVRKILDLLFVRTGC
jgi:hypothetical protein